MTDWNARKNESLSSVPAWLKQAVSDYRQREGLQSWSAAALELMIIALESEHSETCPLRLGDKPFEDGLIAEFDIWDEAQAANGHTVQWLDFLRYKLKPPAHGGDRLSNHATDSGANDPAE